MCYIPALQDGEVYDPRGKVERLVTKILILLEPTKLFRNQEEMLIRGCPRAGDNKKAREIFSIKSP